MSEYTYNDVQEVAYRTPAILTSNNCSRCASVFHRSDSGIITIGGNNCIRFARYSVRYGANIAVPTSGTVGEIDLAITIDGEPILTSIGAATPTVAAAYFNVCGEAIVDIPRFVDYIIAIENVSVTGDPINTRNLRVTVERVM